MKNYIERFWGKVDKESPGGCWLWAAGRNADGYGAFWADGKMWRAHRYSYEHSVGHVPRGLNLDHLCRVRHCVNPDHLEPVTPRANVMRGVGLAPLQAQRTHCPKGHPYSGDNLYVSPRGCRECRTCRREQARAQSRRRMEMTRST